MHKFSVGDSSSLTELLTSKSTERLRKGYSVVELSIFSWECLNSTHSSTILEHSKLDVALKLVFLLNVQQMALPGTEVLKPNKLFARMKLFSVVPSLLNEPSGGEVQVDNPIDLGDKLLFTDLHGLLELVVLSVSSFFGSIPRRIEIAHSRGKVRVNVIQRIFSHVHTIVNGVNL